MNLKLKLSLVTLLMLSISGFISSTSGMKIGGGFATVAQSSVPLASLVPLFSFHYCLSQRLEAIYLIYFYESCQFFV